MTASIQTASQAPEVGPSAQAVSCVPGLAVTALASIEGHSDAQRLLHALRGGCAPADLALEALQQVEAYGDAARLKGFCRELQKHLERVA